MSSTGRSQTIHSAALSVTVPSHFRHALFSQSDLCVASGLRNVRICRDRLRPSSVPLRVNDPLRFIVVVHEGKHPVNSPASTDRIVSRGI